MEILFKAGDCEIQLRDGYGQYKYKLMVYIGDTLYGNSLPCRKRPSHIAIIKLLMKMLSKEVKDNRKFYSGLRKLLGIEIETGFRGTGHYDD